jgi:hypothetical protein
MGIIKRSFPADSKKELFDLDDVPLLEIMKYLDMDSRLGMMGTCFRFHRLSQYNRNFTDYFKLEISSEFLGDPKICDALQAPLRYFGVIVLKNLQFDRYENHFRIRLALTSCFWSSGK